tara:strand:+ start:1082 stop:2593 length:1512 start_codon:yes stop_codon:yes gene_type:complete
MAKRNDLKIQKELLKDIDKLEEKIAERGRATYNEQRRLNALKSASFELASKQINLSKQIDSLDKSALGVINKKLGLEKQIKVLTDIKKAGTKKELENANKLSSIMADVASGNRDFSDALNEIATEDFGKLNEAATEFGKTLRDGGKNLESQVKGAAALKDGFGGVAESLIGIDLSMAGLVAAVVSFALKIKEVRSELGTTVVQSTRLAGNMSLAAASATAFGGSAEQAQAAVTSLVDEFGSVDVVSASVSAKLGSITGQFGLSGDNAGKLLKQMQGISGASIETNLNLIGSVGELARAEGVAPARVLNDIASSTEAFAGFAKAGGDNIARAAVQANKLGLNLDKVVSIAENLLDFESSIAKEMEASQLLGRQINLDKARQLIITNDLEGLQKELVRVVGGQAAFESLDFIQRQALGAALGGVSLSDLGRLSAGQNINLGGAPKMQTGGVVRQTGIAVVHKGETIAGSQFGGRESNKLLKQMLEQNATLMNRLTNKVSEMALNS